MFFGSHTFPDQSLLLSTTILNDDLPNNIASNIELYADDMLLYRSIHAVADVYTLQNDLNTMHLWASILLMSFNPSKCEFL